MKKRTTKTTQRKKKHSASKTHDLPAKKLGGRTIILADDLNRFLRGLPQLKKESK